MRILECDKCGEQVDESWVRSKCDSGWCTINISDFTPGKPGYNGILCSKCFSEVVNFINTKVVKTE